VNQLFHWQAEPVGNNTTAPSATLNLLFATSPGTAAETGLKINSKGHITFAGGQTFPGAGTITGVTAGTGITGGGTSGSVTLNVDTTKIPQLHANNTFTGNQTVNGNVTATGAVTGSSFQIGNRRFAFGSAASENVFLGFAGNTSTTGSTDTAVGYEALFNNTSGNGNTATGSLALSTNSTGAGNTANGNVALEANTTGSFNTAVGESALQSNSTGSNNTAVGDSSLVNNTTGSNNSAVGEFSLLFNRTGKQNSAVGQQALQNNLTGSSNTATGFQALANSNANRNTADGYQALENNSSGSDNTADGEHALLNNTTGIDNTAVGAGALESNQTGKKLTCIGFLCSAGPGARVNATAIGAHAVVSQSNSLVLGGTGLYAVKVGIGTEAPTSVFTIGRGAGHPLSDSWETYSSRRWKTNIQTLPDALAKVEHLRGVSYDLKDSGKHEIGVIAEEVGSVVPELVSYEENGKDARGVDYARLTALLIEATKEQQREIRQLRSELRQTRQSLQQIKTQVAQGQSRLVAVK
jgi:hypothetical protein